MQIPKELIVEAKRKLGIKAAEVIIKDLKIEGYNPNTRKALCPFHDDVNPSFIWYEEGHFYCFACDRSYDILDHFMNFDGLSFPQAVQKLFEYKDVNIEHSFAMLGEKFNREYQYPKYDKNDSRNEVEAYAKIRKISSNTLDYCDITQSTQLGADGCPLMVFNFRDENDVLVTVKYRPAQKIEQGAKMWFQKPADHKMILFNMNKIDPTKPLLITEGEFDALAAIESGFKNTVSVPNGASNTKWIEECFDWLEQFDKIIIWSDNDDPGIKMRRDVCARLGAWRTLYVSLPKTVEDKNGEQHRVKDINEVLFCLGKQAVLDYIKNAQEVPIEGVDDLASIDDFDLEKAEGLSPHLEPLRDIMYKFLFGSVVLVTGMRGAGKSTMINQLFVCDPLDRGYDIFLYSGELYAPILKSWLERTMAGREHIKSIDSFVHLVEEETLGKMRKWYSNRVWIYNEADNDADRILEKAIATTRKYGVKVWVLDNLMTLDINADDRNINIKQKEFIVKLKSYACMYNVLIILVTHPRKLMSGAQLTTDDIAGSGDLGNMAHYIMSVRRFNDQEKEGEADGRGGYKKGKEPINEDSEIRIMKNRYTGKIGAAKLDFDYSSYRFYSNKDELYYRYKWHKNSGVPKDVHLVYPIKKDHGEIPSQFLD